MNNIAEELDIPEFILKAKLEWEDRNLYFECPHDFEKENAEEIFDWISEYEGYTFYLEETKYKPEKTIWEEKIPLGKRICKKFIRWYYCE